MYSFLFRGGYPFGMLTFDINFQNNEQLVDVDYDVPLVQIFLYLMLFNMYWRKFFPAIISLDFHSIT